MLPAPKMQELQLAPDRVAAVHAPEEGARCDLGHHEPIQHGLHGAIGRTRYAWDGNFLTLALLIGLGARDLEENTKFHGRSRPQRAL